MAGTARSIPGSIATHRAVQDFFFGDDLLLRRHDYNVELAGGFGAAHWCTTISERTAFACQASAAHTGVVRIGTPHFDPLMVSIDISDVRFS